MTDILLIIIIAMLVYMIHIMKEQTGSEEKEKKKISYQKVLPEYLNKMCEIIEEIIDPFFPKPSFGPSHLVILSMSLTIVHLTSSSVKWDCLPHKVRSQFY